MNNWQPSTDLKVGDKLIYKSSNNLTATVHDITDDGFVFINVIVLGQKQLAKHTIREINFLFNREHIVFG